MPLVNQNIKILRRRVGLTQEKFAEKLGIKRSLLGAYEENRAIPPAENLKKICEIFGVSLDHLLNHSFEKLNIGLPTYKNFDNNKFQNLHLELENSLFKNSKSAEMDLFESQDLGFSTNMVSNENLKIRYVSSEISESYCIEKGKASFLEALPCFILPNLPKGYLRAFDAPEDFLMPESILIGERVENFDLLKNGENHLLVTTKGLIYRRIYNQISIKNALLLSSDKENIKSEEMKISEVLEIWVVKLFMSKTMPMPINGLDSVQEKINILKSEIDDMVSRQSKK